MGKQILLGLVLCASLQTAHADNTSEKILGYQPSKHGITFQVQSGGCTTKESFIVDVQRATDGIAQVTLLRTRPDTCHPFLPMGVRFRMTYEELGLNPGERYRIVNLNGVVYGSAWE